MLLADYSKALGQHFADEAVFRLFYEILSAILSIQAVV